MHRYCRCCCIICFDAHPEHLPRSALGAKHIHVLRKLYGDIAAAETFSTSLRVLDQWSASAEARGRVPNIVGRGAAPHAVTPVGGISMPSRGDGAVCSPGRAGLIVVPDRSSAASGLTRTSCCWRMYVCVCMYVWMYVAQVKLVWARHRWGHEWACGQTSSYRFLLSAATPSAVLAPVAH